jgi:hypothetical protein
MRVDLVLARLHERAREEEEVGGGFDSDDDEASAADDSSGGDGDGGAFAAGNRALHQLTPKNRHRAHRVARPRTVLAAGEAGGGSDAAGAAAAPEGQGAAAAALASARTGAADAAIAHLTANNCELLDEMLGLLAEHERERREEPATQERLDVDLHTLRVHNGMKCYEAAKGGKRRLAFSAARSGAWQGAPGGRFDSIETQVIIPLR